MSKAKKWMRRLALGIGGLLFLLSLMIFISGKWYIYRALWYNLAEIDDWKHFPARTIAAAPARPLPASVDYNQGKIPQDVLDRHQRLGSVAYLALRNDSVIHEQYWDGFSDSSVSSSFSMAKSMVGVLVGIAVDRGFIKSIDEPVGNYLPSYKKGKRALITIRHLLNMSSGLFWDESYINPWSLTTESYFGSRLEDICEKLEVYAAPGTYFDYASGNQIVLQQVMLKATGMPLSDFMGKYLWQPLGARHPATWSLDRDHGNEKAFCCVNSNIRDFSLLGLLYLHHGFWNGKQIVSESYVKESVTAVPLTDEYGKTCKCYGLSWWISEMTFKGKSYPVYYMRGILGQYVLVLPDLHLVVSRLGHQRDETYSGPDKHHRLDVFEYTRGILEAYY